tara:strand:- start:7013 stop:7627 length:615 start_codon:yes stop_codon:yes gene_type:complete
MILFDGCSFTFGDELENPEKDAFPHLVARMGLMDGAKPRLYTSIGECGKSNDGILRTTINFCENNPVTLAIIQFTNFSRREVMNSGKDTYFRINAENPDEGSLEYFKHFQNKNDDVANYHKNKFLLESYFKKRNIRYFFLNLQKMKLVEGYTPSSWYHLADKSPVSNMKTILGGKRWHPENYVTGHPNKRGHQLIAQHIYENIF